MIYEVWYAGKRVGEYETLKEVNAVTKAYPRAPTEVYQWASDNTKLSVDKSLYDSLNYQSIGG